MQKDFWKDESKTSISATLRDEFGTKVVLSGELWKDFNAIGLKVLTVDNKDWLQFLNNIVVNARKCKEKYSNTLCKYNKRLIYGRILCIHVLTLEVEGYKTYVRFRNAQRWHRKKINVWFIEADNFEVCEASTKGHLSKLFSDTASTYGVPFVKKRKRM